MAVPTFGTVLYLVEHRVVLYDVDVYTHSGDLSISPSSHHVRRKLWKSEEAEEVVSSLSE